MLALPRGLPRVNKINVLAHRWDAVRATQSLCFSRKCPTEIDPPRHPGGKGRRISAEEGMMRRMTNWRTAERF